MTKPKAWKAEWNAQLDALLACRTRKEQRVAIRKLLLSDEEIGPSAREVIAELYFPAQGRPKKAGSGFRAGLAVAFRMHRHPPETAAERERLIKKMCEKFVCSRADFDEHWHYFTHPAFQAALREGMREGDIP